MLVGDINRKLKFYVYPDDHNPPHVHAVYGNDEKLAAIEIKTGEVLGNQGFSPSDLKLITRWIADRREDLIAQWEYLHG